MARVFILLIAVAASVALLFGVTTLNADESMPTATPAEQTASHASSVSTDPGIAGIRPTLIAPPNQPTYTPEDVIEYLHEPGSRGGVGSRASNTIEDITFMTADAANTLFNTSVSRSGTHPICVVTLHGEFPTSGPYGSVTGPVSEMRLVFDGVTGNLLMTTGSRG